MQTMAAYEEFKQAMENRPKEEGDFMDGEVMIDKLTTQ